MSFVSLTLIGFFNFINLHIALTVIKVDISPSIGIKFFPFIGVQIFNLLAISETWFSTKGSTSSITSTFSERFNKFSTNNSGIG